LKPARWTGQALHSLGATVQAVCDIDADKAAAAKELLRAEHAFTDYEAMLADGGCTCVLIGSPMPFHVAQSIAALERGIHVLCEVTAGITIAECRELVLAAARSEALFMMAENICYDRTAVLINSLVDSGSMGEVRSIAVRRGVTHRQRRWHRRDYSYSACVP
jgi:predicted dehydrogenase